MHPQNKRWLTGGEYRNIHRSPWVYALAAALMAVGVGLMLADRWFGLVLALGPFALVGVDLCVRAPRLRRQAFSQLEERAPGMSTAEIDDHLAFIVRFYGGGAGCRQ